MLIFKKLISFVTLIATAIILSFSLLYTVPQLFGVEPYTILSGSMSPMISVGSVVFINTKDRDPEINDVIAFYDAGYTGKVVHRVIENTADGMITKGDANDTIDLALLTSDRVIGSYLFHIPKAGFALDKKKPILTLYCALLLLEYAISDFGNGKEDEVDDNDQNEEA